MKVRRIQVQCNKIYDQISVRSQLDSFPSGGKLDAFRHVFYMAAFAQKVRTKKIRKLGMAHEKGNYLQFTRSQLEEGERPDSLASVMDLQNNELGLAIGCNNRRMPLSGLSVTCIAAINGGKAVILKRNRNGDYVSCDGKVIPMDADPKWHVPKCLIASDQAADP